MSIRRLLLGFALAPLLTLTVVSAQQTASAMNENDIGADNQQLAQQAGLWDVTETTWGSPTALPTKKTLVAERRMIGSFLEETLEPAPNSSATNILRIDYLSFNRIEGRWKYLSMDTRAPVGLMPAASPDRGDAASIHLIFEPFAIPVAGSNIGQLLLMQEIITQTDATHNHKDQYFNTANGSGNSWLGHKYEYVRRSLHGN